VRARFASLVELENPVLRLKKAGDILYAISGKEFIKIESALGYDEANVYASIRNGGFAVIHKATGEVKGYSISESSIWEMIISEYIYAGNVDGNLLVIDKPGIKVLKKKAVHKKNLKSLLLEDEIIYTASQDLSIVKINKDTLEIIDSHKHCHKKMFYYAGIWQDFLLTVSPPCGEMKIWNKQDLSLCKTIGRGTWGSFIDGDILYEISGNTIFCSDLNELIARG
jgi:hypothetical protein